MPSAPTLNKPPRLEGPPTLQAPSSPKAPSASWATPSGATQDTPLRTAALGASTRNNPLASEIKPPPAKPPSGLSTSTGASTHPYGTGNTAVNTPRPPAPAAPTVPPSTGAPPGVPDTTIPPVPADEQTISDALSDYSTAQSAANYGMGQAAFAYGDPTQMERFGVGSINPNSALAIAALRAQQQQQTATNQRGAAGTLFSSLALEDRSKIGDAQKRAQLQGFNRYNQALGRFNAALTQAASIRDRAIRGAREDEAAQAVKNLPTTIAPMATPPAPGSAVKPPPPGGRGTAPKTVTKPTTKGEMNKHPNLPSTKGLSTTVKGGPVLKRKK